MQFIRTRLPSHRKHIDLYIPFHLLQQSVCEINRHLQMWWLLLPPGPVHWFGYTVSLHRATYIICGSYTYTDQRRTYIYIFICIFFHAQLPFFHSARLCVCRGLPVVCIFGGIETNSFAADVGHFTRRLLGECSMLDGMVIGLCSSESGFLRVMKLEF